MKPTVFIGVGNAMRSDDGVGIAIVRELTKIHNLNADSVEGSGEGTELINAWEGYEQVYLFDAVMNQGQSGRIHRLEPGAILAQPTVERGERALELLLAASVVVQYRLCLQLASY